MRMRITLAIVMAAVLAGSAAAEDPVYFADEALKTAVEEELWISDPTPTDMLGLTSLYTTSLSISDLTGLEYAVNLQSLHLINHDITSVSPLSGLSNLETLVINNNDISDISPLSGLTNLDDLDVHDNQISSVSPLSGLTKLTRLVIRDNDISDISALSGLPHLRQLIACRNQISDISALLGYTELDWLDLEDNPLNVTAYDVHIPQIIENNPGVTVLYTPANPRRLEITSSAGGSIIAPGEGVFFYPYDELVILKAQADPGFVFVGFTGTLATNWNPTTVSMDQDHKIHADFESVLQVIHVDDDAPQDPGPGQAQVSDPQEDGTPEHPFDRIQEAIDVAIDGVTVVVRPGTYHENIDLSGKSIHLTGLGPDGRDGDPYPIIEGAEEGPVVTFDSGEDERCTLTGFVITRGTGDLAGAIYCEGSRPTVTHCLVVGNRATDPNGAAVYCLESQVLFSNCTIVDNYAGDYGAGLVLVDSPVVVVDSILWGNFPDEIIVTGTAEPSITYSNIAGWWADFGNTDNDPIFASEGHWADARDPNVALKPDQPHATWVDGDYHLKSQTGRWDSTTQTWLQDDVTSPCIDGGYPASPVGLEPLPNGGMVNMGAYGGTAQASQSGAGKY